MIHRYIIGFTLFFLICAAPLRAQEKKGLAWQAGIAKVADQLK